MVRSWSRAQPGRLREQMKLPAAAGVRALAVCPPDGPGRAPFVVATTDEILGGSMITSRRSFLVEAGAIAASLASPRVARAMGRTPAGGKFSLHVPFALASIDPHELSDPAAALFASAIADPVFAFDAAGNAYPSLVQAMPVRDGGVTTVKLREGLRTARGVPLDARDLIFSSSARAPGVPLRGLAISRDPR